MSRKGEKMGFDFDALESELNGMVEEDDDYWRRNDAKFRAAKQGATYEEFQQIVKVILKAVLKK